MIYCKQSNSSSPLTLKPELHKSDRGVSLKYPDFHIQYGKRSAPYANTWVCQEWIWLPVPFPDNNYSITVMKPQLGNVEFVFNMVPICQPGDAKSFLGGYQKPGGGFQPGSSYEFYYLAIWVRH